MLRDIDFHGAPAFVWSILAWLAMGFASNAIAQGIPFTITFIPPAPTARDPIIARILIAPCFVRSTTVTYPAADRVQIDLGSGGICPLPPIQVTDAPIGRLPEGIYTVEVYYGGVRSGAATLAVGAAIPAVPTLSDTLLMMLIALVAALGCFARKSARPGRT